MEDRIEQRITIRANQDKVWQLVTRPGWWLPGSKTEPARSPVRLPVEYGGDSRPYMIDVVRVEPQGYVSFRWASAFGGAAPVPGNATLVEFYLRPVGDEVGVTVVESGFASLDLSDALREDAWKGNTGGWQYELAGLRIRAEQGTKMTDPAGYSPRSPIRAVASCSSCSPARRAPPPGRWRPGCRSPARRSPSTWPCSRSARSSAVGGPDGRYCSASGRTA